MPTFRSVTGGSGSLGTVTGSIIEVRDPTTTTQKLAINSSGRVGVNVRDATTDARALVIDANGRVGMHIRDPTTDGSILGVDSSGRIIVKTIPSITNPMIAEASNTALASGNNVVSITFTQRANTMLIIRRVVSRYIGTAPTALEFAPGWGGSPMIYRETSITSNKSVQFDTYWVVDVSSGTASDRRVDVQVIGATLNDDLYLDIFGETYSLATGGYLTS